jgi:hypothetical protein
VSAVDAEMVEQADRVAGHVLERVARRALVAQQQLEHGRDRAGHRLRAADVAVVVADHEEPAAG